MICNTCQTTLPDEAIACWKCGMQLSTPVARAPVTRRPIDPLLAILTLLISVAFFVCVGWAVPFTIWGNIITLGRQFPAWGPSIDIVSGVAFYGSALGLFVGAWWGSYKLIQKLYPTA